MEARTIEVNYRNPFKLIKSSIGINLYTNGVYPYTKGLFSSLKRFICRKCFLTLKKIGLTGFGVMEINSNNSLAQKTLQFNAANSQYHSVYMPFYESGYELETTMMIDYFIQRKPDLIFFDIGANWGHMSLFALSNKNFSGKIFAFEPFPSSFNDLKLISSITDKNNFSPINIALGDKEECVSFHKNDAIHSGTISVSSNNNNNANEFNAISLDQFCNMNNNIAPDLLKIDVEGFEINVLKGSLATLKKHSPYILLENNKNDKSSLEVLSFLEKIGYKTYYPCLIENTTKMLIEQGQYHKKDFSKKELLLYPTNPQNRNILQDHINVVCIPYNEKASIFL